MGTIVSTHKSDYYSEKTDIDLSEYSLMLESEDYDEEDFFADLGFTKLDDCEDPPEGDHYYVVV